MRFANLACLVFACAGGFGQTFEVASVRPSAPVPPTGGVYFGPLRGGPGTSDPGRITWSYATLKGIVMLAYDMKNYQVNGPEWLGSQRYDVAAKVPEGSTKEQVMAMWQNLLAERFGMTLHRESREFRVEELVVASGGHKLVEVPEDPAAADGPPKFSNGKLNSAGFVTMVEVTGATGPRALSMAKAQPLSKLTEMLTNQLRRPVLDKTGLAGHYDFRIEFAPNMAGVPPPPTLAPPPPLPDGINPGNSASEPGPELAAAVQKQLGLKLVASRAKLDVLVIDKAEKIPTEN
ncbi:MAG TPA: TIGR03435 family protein [Bryobacteraceae bacterium]|nr:TIGR03435 family protein [Bryobacteraceae bacterium]